MASGAALRLPCALGCSLPAYLLTYLGRRLRRFGRRLVLFGRLLFGRLDHGVDVPVSGLGRRSAVSGRPLDGWRVASKGMGPLPRRRGSALAQGCDRGGRVALPLARAAAVSTGLRVLAREVRIVGEGG